MSSVCLAICGFSLAEAFGLAGCAAPLRGHAFEYQKVSSGTGRVFGWNEVRQAAPGIVLGNEMYAEVSSVWLKQWYSTYREELFRLGVLRWDQRFDCNRFAGFYAGLAQACYYREMFNRRSEATALALGPFWYLRDDGRGGHAIVQVLTERGRVFIDPQTGDEVKLSAREVASAFLQYF